ncbi:hypothetical protein CAP35_09070 [Chitinophagaceae bacterium IBVUCB1]|nr:hypothetical protein CAP35_09070 [Chitinophagaceae bacterium IBVUCB1]
MKHLLLILFACIAGSASIAGTPDTIQIHFDLDKDVLNKTNKTLLEGFVYEDVINKQTDVLIIGYADYLGSNEYNIDLSKRRAKAIKDLLTSLLIPEENIKLCIGKGEVSRLKERQGGYATDRRVDVVVSQKKTKNLADKPILTKAKTPAQATRPAPKQLNQINELKVGETIRLENIYFVLGRHILTDNSLPILDKLYETMENNPSLKIQIEGHICCLRYGYDALDEDTQDMKLSENRAKYIYDYLAQKGIEKDRMNYVGFGRTKPLIKPELTTEDEDKNRRVEIRVTAK